MIWQAILYVCSIAAGVTIVLFSRQLVSIKKWYDISFLQGGGLILWGLSHLMINHPDPVMRIISLPLASLFYLFFLMSLHVCPLAPHIYYDQWKTILDSAAFLAIYGATVLTTVFSPAEAGSTLILLHLFSGLLLVFPLVTVYMANSRLNGKQNERKAELLLATLLLIVTVMLHQLLPEPVVMIFGVLSIGILVFAHYRFPRNRSKAVVMDEHSYLHEQLHFSIQDSNAMQVLLITQLIAMLTWRESWVYMIGFGIAAIITTIRIYLTKSRNQSLIRQTLKTAGSLEKKFSEQLEQIQGKNYQLSKMLSLKQTYEKLLLASNEQSLREVSYENLQQVIEELVDVWFAKMDNMVYLRLSLESQDGVVYYEIIRGDEDHSSIQRAVTERIAVDEEQDTPLVPRYVVMQAKCVTENEEELLLEQSFYQLLIVNVRGLILRCLQENQLLELRLMEQEMELAQKIQRMLMPDGRLLLPKLEAKAVFLPYTYVGGDYIDYLKLDERRTCFVIADVSGHGLSASLMTTGIRSAVRAVTQTCWEPELILQRLNSLLYEDLIKTRSFITMLVAIYDSHEHALLISRAGHPQPLYLTASGAALLPCCGGLGLGLSPDSFYERETIPLKEEGILLAYTDGLLDLSRNDLQRCVNQWLEGFTRLRHEGLLSEDEDSIAIVENYVKSQTSESLQTDDISLLILRFQSGTEQEAVIDDVV